MVLQSFYPVLMTDDPALSLRYEEFGQRHFIVVDPDGNLIDVIQNIPPTDSFAAAYTDGGG
jgi:hypothetical protein